jgi:hypothetical protein
MAMARPRPKPASVEIEPQVLARRDCHRHDDRRSLEPGPVDAIANAGGNADADPAILGAKHQLW